MKTSLDRLLAQRLAGLALAGLLAACGGGGSDAPPPPPPAATASIATTVIDTFGRFVAGATVAAGSASATTDALGRATLAVATGSEQAVHITKSGFADQVKVLSLAPNATSGQLQAMLIERDAAQTIASIEAGGVAAGRDGVKVTFPANALVTAAGLPVTGSVQMLMTPVNIAEIDVGAFPGLFEGLPTGAARQAIISYGTAELIPQQGGQVLALAAGKSAVIELPLYSNKHQNGNTVAAGDTIALWSLDLASGLWRQEGSGTVTASAASPSGFVLRATITHFSWWNGDSVSQRAAVNLTVNAPGTNAPANTSANVIGNVIAGSGPASTATGTATIGTAQQFGVTANATTRLEAQAQFGNQHCRGSVDVSPPLNATVNATINLSCFTLPTPTIVQPTAFTATNSQRAVSFHIVVDGGQPDKVELLANGTPIAQFSPQAFYRGFWDTAGFAEGTYSLTPRVTQQGISNTGTSVTVVIDRTRPQSSGFAPATTTEVDRDTVFTVNFNEPVNPGPFALTDVVRLSVVPIGQSAPVNIPIDATLDTAGQLLTVRPTAVLLFGVASLTWGALRDAADNAIDGTITASWNVSRSARLGSDLPLEINSRMALATDGAGVAHVVARLLGSGNLQALRFDGVDFVPFGPAINERTPGVIAALAIDRNGAVIVALEQLDSGGTNGEVLVRRFDSASNLWQTLGAPFPVGRILNSSPTTFAVRPTLAIDAANRLVLAFGSGASFNLEGHRFDGTAWSALGTINDNIDSFALTINGAGNPVVAYVQSLGNNLDVLRAAEHKGAGWIGIGQIDASGHSTIGVPQIATAADGRPWVAWQGQVNSQNVSLSRFDGTAFVAVAIDPALRTYNGNVGLTFLNGDPVVAGGHEFDGGFVDVRRLRNGVWEPQLLVACFGNLRATSLATSGNSVLVGMDTQLAFDGLARVTRVEFP